MGERGNIVVHFDEEHEVWFYTHWRGYDIQHIVQYALKRGQDRWDDPPYLARIIFSSLFCYNGEDINYIWDNLTSLTGFGIYFQEVDNNYPIVHVFIDSQNVQIDSKIWTFNDFVLEERLDLNDVEE